MLDCLQEPPPYLSCNEFEAHEIVPKLYLGDYSSASKRDALKERGVTHILNCARIARNWFPEAKLARKTPFPLGGGGKLTHLSPGIRNLSIAISK